MENSSHGSELSKLTNALAATKVSTTQSAEARVLALPDIVILILANLSNNDLTKTARFNKLWFRESIKYIWRGQKSATFDKSIKTMASRPESVTDKHDRPIIDIRRLQRVGKSPRFRLYCESVRRASFDVALWVRTSDAKKLGLYKFYKQLCERFHFITPQLLLLVLKLPTEEAAPVPKEHYNRLEALLAPGLQHIEVQELRNGKESRGLRQMSDVNLFKDILTMIMMKWTIHSPASYPSLTLSEVLKGFPQLEEASLGAVKLGRDDIGLFSKHRSIRHIGVEYIGAAPTAKDFHDDPFPVLMSLSLTCHALTFPKIAVHATHLISLEICMKVNGNDVEEGDRYPPSVLGVKPSADELVKNSLTGLQNLRKLMVLRLSYSKATWAHTTPERFRSLPCLGRAQSSLIADALSKYRLGSLMYLQIKGTVDFIVTDADVIAIGLACPMLTVLEFIDDEIMDYSREKPAITTLSLVSLSSSCSILKSIKFNSLMDLTPAIGEKYPPLVFRGLSSCYFDGILFEPIEPANAKPGWKSDALKNILSTFFSNVDALMLSGLNLAGHQMGARTASGKRAWKEEAVESLTRHMLLQDDHWKAMHGGPVTAEVLQFGIGGPPPVPMYLPPFA